MKRATLRGPEREVLVSSGSIHDRDSEYYQRVTTRTREDGRVEITISGVDILLKDGAPNGIFRLLDRPRTGRRNPEGPEQKRPTVVIAADTITLCGELSLPEVDVTIYARRLELRDGGRINTSPLDWDVAKAQDGDPVLRARAPAGADGPTAGAILLFVGDVVTQVDASAFIAAGGCGQDAGKGFDGRDGDRMSSVSNQFELTDSWHKNTSTASFSHPCVYADYYWKWGFIPQYHGNRGANKWPTSGQDAVEPGVPGSGGDGGQFTTTCRSAVALVSNAGGKAGAMASRVRGGRAGTPSPCAHYEVNIAFDLASSTAKASVRDIGGGAKSTKEGAAYEGPKPAPGSRRWRRRGCDPD